jgi:protocatechuate 3,4-dioxygenase beta subunit
MVAKRLPLSAATLTMMFTASVPAWAETVSGRVLGPDGKPIAGATITLPRYDDTAQGVTAAVTDDRGVFRLEIPGKGPTGDNAAPMYVLIAYAPGFALKEVRVTVGGTTEVRLDPEGTVKGRVLAGGKPVAGARVRLRTVIKGERFPDMQFIAVPDGLLDRLTTKTGADGSYSLSGIPRDFKALVELDDPRFVRLSVQAPLNGQPEASAPVLDARPAGVVQGRALLPDGKPAVGMRVFAQAHSAGNGYANAVTNAEGRYVLAGLPSGIYNIMADAPTKEVIAAAVEGVTVTEGKTLDAGDMRLTGGALVEGRAVDANTGQPLANVYIGSYGPHRPRSSGAIIGTSTDAEGKYRLRVAPGESYLYVSGIAPGYVRDDKANTTLKLASGETKTLDFRLKKGVTLNGRVTDEAGKGVGGLNLRVQVRYEDAYAVTKEDGSFTVSGLCPEDATLTLTSEEWDLEGPTKIPLPAEQPVSVRVKRSNRVALTGRAVDTSGAPIAGVAIKAQVQVQLGGGLSTTADKTATTDANGQFRIPGLKPDDKAALFASRDGYRFLRGGEIGAAENGMRPATDLILAALNRTLQGQVLGTDGKPVVGATVVSADGLGSSAVTDRAGQFSLSGLPAGETGVITAAGSAFARADLKNGESSTVLSLVPMPLPTKPDVARASEMLEELYRETATANYNGRASLVFDLVPYDLERALRLAADGKPTIPDDRARAILVNLSLRDPARAVAFGVPRLGMFNDAYMRRAFYVDMGRAYVRLGRTVEVGDMYKRLAADVAESGALKPDVTANWERIYALTFLTTLGALSRVPETESLAQRTLAMARKLMGDKDYEEQGFGAAVIGGIAEGDPLLAEKIALTLPEKARPQAFREAIEKTAVYSPTGARNMLRRMADGGANKEGFEGREYGRAAVRTVEALVPKDPEGAIAIARGVADKKWRGLALATVARHLPTPEKRTALYREAFDLTLASGEYNFVTPAARIAGMAAKSDPALAKTLFERMYELKPGGGDNPNMDAVAALGFYSARILPARARLLLETSFAAGVTGSYARQHGGYYLAKLATAMAALDPERALEMANQLPGTGNERARRYDTRRDIARFLLDPTGMEINEEGRFELRRD